MPDYIRIVCGKCKTAHRVKADLPPTTRMSCVKCNSEMAMPESARQTIVIGTASLAGTQDDSGVSLAVSDAPTVPTDNPHAKVESVEGLLQSAAASTGRYIEQGVIGKGGMGEIVLCVDRNIRRQVAIKRMLPQSATHPVRRARFVEEAQITGQLEHPNIVPVHELDKDADGTIYFTMKLVKGKSLAEVLEVVKNGEEARSLGDLLTIFLKVCDGVAFAHSRGVVHRDLKPANIMIGDFGEVLVMDWGIAKIIKMVEAQNDGERLTAALRQDADQFVVSSGRDSGELHTMAGAALGTPTYMSPEQAAGKLDEIDARSDIYSLGCILYELLTLCRPVEGLNARAILDKVINEEVTPPDRRTPERHIPRELSAVVMKCLGKARQDRYQSVGELSRDLKLFLEGRSVSARPDTFVQAVIKLVKRNKGISGAIAVAASIIIVLTTVFVVNLASERNRAVTNERQAIAARQKERETALASAKRFAMQAIREAETGRWEEAERRAKDAEDVALNSPWGMYARAMFASVKSDYKTAADRFREALKLDPDHPESKAGLAEAVSRQGNLEQAVALAGDAGSISDWRALVKIGQTLYHADRLRECQAPLKRALVLMEKEKDASVQQRTETMTAVQEQIDTAAAKVACEGFEEEIKKLPPEEQVTRVETQLSEINGVPIAIQKVVIRNGEWVEARPSPQDKTNLVKASERFRFIYPLRGLPFRKLYLNDTRAKDLTPLRGMPLEELVTGCAACDLSPLSGMPLRTLVAGGYDIQDLSPLAGMPLENLTIQGTQVNDLSPLRGLKTKHLNLQGVRKIVSIDALTGMPLKTVCLEDCYSISDLTPLEGIALTSLNIEDTGIVDLTPLQGMKLEEFGFTPKRIKKGIHIVREMRSVKKIGLGLRTGPGMAPEEFWKKYDAGEFNE